MAEKRVRSPTGETPVQETKRPSRTPWNVEEKEFLEKYVKAAGGIPRTSTMKFWEKCAEDLNKTFSTARTAQMCRCKITKVKNLMEDFESAQDIMHTLVNQFSQTDVSLCSDANTNLEPQPHLKMDQLPTFKNSETTTEAEKSIQSSLLDRLGSDNMFSCAQKSECINIILNSKTKGHFIDYLFQDAEFKSEISRKLSKEMELNASTKCIRNPDSYLFNKNYDDLKQFSFQNVIQEMSQCQPDLLKFLLAVAVPSNRIGKPVSSLLPKFSLIYSILMSSRFHELSRLQRVISTVLMEEQVHEKVFDRLQKLGVSTSPDVCSRLLDDIGGHFNNEVIALLHAGKSFRFVGDNVNFTVGVKSERQDSKPQVCNWFASCVITQTLTFPDLLDVSQGRTRDLDVSHFLPTAYDERKLKDDYKVLISRIVKTFLPHLTFLYEGQPKHILDTLNNSYWWETCQSLTGHSYS